MDRPARVGFFGPFGTFAEQAVRRSPTSLRPSSSTTRPCPTCSTRSPAGEVDCGVVPMENSIEGVVNFTQDALAFDYDLLIQREIVLDIEHCLIAARGMTLDQVKAVISIPVATAQCHRFLREHLRSAEVRESARPPLRPASSPRATARTRPSGLAAIANRMAAERYGLAILAADIADHPGNQTRFVVVGREGMPRAPVTTAPACVVFQRADVPGSLVSILQEFAARRINLSNLISRPTKAAARRLLLRDLRRRPRRRRAARRRRCGRCTSSRAGSSSSARTRSPASRPTTTASRTTPGGTPPRTGCRACRR